MLEIKNLQGQKYTLQEYFKEYNEGSFQIVSNIFGGTLITGDYEYIKGHLRKHFFSACVQGIDKTEYGIIIYLR